MTLRPCLTCGKPSHNARCAKHAIDTRSVYNSAAYRTDRATLLASSIGCHWCGQPFTPTNPPTADHDPPLIHDVNSRRLVAAHRSCNSRRGATTRGDRGAPENLSTAQAARYTAVL